MSGWSRGFTAVLLLVPVVGVAGALRSLATGGQPGSPIAFGESASVGGLQKRLAPPDDANVVLLYTAEGQGNLVPCGCELHPRGGLGRTLAYVDAVRHREPALLLNAGNWLDDRRDETGALRDDVQRNDAVMIQAIGDFDALNISFRDLPYLAITAFLPTSVSANVVGPGILPYRIVDQGGVRVAITGVSPIGMAWAQPAGFTYRPIVDALTEVVPQMTASADVVVVLAYGAGGDVTQLVRRVPGIDVVIDADGYRERWDPIVDHGVVWVHAQKDGQRLGELRLVVRDGAVIGAVDRQVDLDETMPESAAVLRWQRQAQSDKPARLTD